MNRKVWTALAAGLFTLGAGTQTWAHHSFAAVYDMANAIKITGTKNAGMLRELVTADGTVYGMFGPREGPDAR